MEAAAERSRVTFSAAGWAGAGNVTRTPGAGKVGWGAAMFTLTVIWPMLTLPVLEMKVALAPWKMFAWWSATGEIVHGKGPGVPAEPSAGGVSGRAPASVIAGLAVALRRAVLAGVHGALGLAWRAAWRWLDFGSWIFRILLVDFPGTGSFGCSPALTVQKERDSGFFRVMSIYHYLTASGGTFKCGWVMVCVVIGGGGKKL